MYCTFNLLYLTLPITNKLYCHIVLTDLKTDHLIDQFQQQTIR